MWQLARLKHDTQIYGMSRTKTTGWGGRKSTPETRIIQQARILLGFIYRLKGKLTLKLPENWQNYLRALQPNSRVFKALIGDKTGWFNGESGGFPNFETIGFGGNAVNVQKVAKGIYRVQTFILTNQPPNVIDYDFYLHPELVHNFTVVGSAGQIFKLAVGNAYIFLISDREMYIPESDIELFPELPMQVTVTTGSGIKVHELPNAASPKIVDIPYGTNLVIEEYVLRGSEVWGKIADQGYIALFYPYYKLPYLTTWKMETTPPPI